MRLRQPLSFSPNIHAEAAFLVDASCTEWIRAIPSYIGQAFDLRPASKVEANLKAKCHLTFVTYSV